MIKEERDLAGSQSEVVRRRLVCKVSGTAILIDLTRDRKFFPQLADPNSYSFTQQISKRIRDEQHPGLLCPSARQPEGKNLAIFNGTCLSNPELVDQLVYRLSLKSMTINVYREGQITTTIDGNQFLCCKPSLKGHFNCNRNRRMPDFSTGSSLQGGFFPVQNRAEHMACKIGNPGLVKVHVIVKKPAIVHGIGNIIVSHMLILLRRLA